MKPNTERERPPSIVSNTVSQFGQNQWLVDEMYERYTKDPSSVDSSWHEYFEANPEAASASGKNSTGGARATYRRHRGLLLWCRS